MPAGARRSERGEGGAGGHCGQGAQPAGGLEVPSTSAAKGEGAGVVLPVAGWG